MPDSDWHEKYMQHTVHHHHHHEDCEFCVEDLQRVQSMKLPDTVSQPAPGGYGQPEMLDERQLTLERASEISAPREISGQGAGASPQARQPESEGETRFPGVRRLARVLKTIEDKQNRWDPADGHTFDPDDDVEVDLPTTGGTEHNMSSTNQPRNSTPSGAARFLGFVVMVFLTSAIFWETAHLLTEL